MEKTINGWMWIVRLFWDYVVVCTKFKSFIIFVGTFSHHYFASVANTNYPLGKIARNVDKEEFDPPSLRI